MNLTVLFDDKVRRWVLVLARDCMVERIPLGPRKIEDFDEALRDAAVQVGAIPRWERGANAERPFAKAVL